MWGNSILFGSTYSCIQENDMNNFFDLTDPVCKDPGTEISAFDLCTENCTHDTALNTGVQSHNAVHTPFLSNSTIYFCYFCTRKLHKSNININININLSFCVCPPCALW